MCPAVRSIGCTTRTVKALVAVAFRGDAEFRRKQAVNLDILFWKPLLERSFEISSMGIRVDEKHC